MKVLHTWICFFFLSLQDEHTALTNAVTVYTGTEGGDVTARCHNSWYNSLKIFCRPQCEEKDILIRTPDVRAQRDKYSIEWKRKGNNWGEVFVTITQLNKSDSGRYRCGYYGSGHSYYEEIYIIVVDALLDGSSSEGKNISRQTGGEILVACSFSESSSWKSFCREECEGQNILAETTWDRVQRGRYSIEYIRGSSSGGIMYVSISQLTESDSGRYRCVQNRFSFQPAIMEFNIVVTDATTQSSDSEQQQEETTGTTATTQSSDSEQQQDETAGTTGLLPYVMVIIVVTVIVGLTLMIVCIQRRHKPKCWRSRGNSGATNMEIADYENCPPVFPGEDSTYQSLDPASRDQDQIYTTITDTKC